LPLLGPLKCSVCGSADLQQVKPETYFCNHCESVSKLVDPARVTVEPAFCAHGDPITARCQVCGTGLCAEACEMVRQGAARKDKVATVGFGYLKVEKSPDSDVVPAPIGPFLTRGKLLDSLAITSGQAPRHVCEVCLLDAVPGTAEHLASGALCRDPWCMYGGSPLGACTCCGGAFCDQSVRLGMPYEWRNHGGVVACDARVSFAYSLEDSVVEETRIGVKALVPLGNGRFCLPCKYERAQRVTEQGREIALRTYGPVLPRKSDTGTNPDTWVVFQVPVAKKGGWRRQAERDRALGLAKQYAAELGASISRSLVGCQRREQFHQRPRYRSWVDYTARYVFLDERVATPATAAGSWL
jgi:hypothetical protein